jgi:eukaryotic-like serine/threonine-protein kinase
MAPAQWEQVKTVFTASLGLKPEQRAAFLDRELGHEPGLRAEVESLLAAHRGAGRFLDEPVLELPSIARAAEEIAPDDGGALNPGDRLGVYTIVQKIDEGGMAVVYQAVRHDAEFRKLVAIKVLKPGMDTHFVLERFQKEKQILAHFDHPYIAMLLDSGSTAAGRPYFVLEFIAGRPLNVYCDENRLPIDERLKLFQRVCAAVEYAHQNLVVHRDLKPRNILVTADGDPKLLDFGIAKILSDDRELTVAGIRPMTPEYASPEQIRGEPVSTATDIYCLGVILYELLTGCRPFRAPGGNTGELARMIVETVPRRPSTLMRSPQEARNAPCEAAQAEKWAKRLRGDLDNIVLKAMHPEAGRRYRSVGELSDDIGRYFRGELVLAAGHDWRYRARKFVIRYRTGVIAAGIVFASLTAGLLAVEHEAIVARNQRALAERRAAEIRRLANSLIFDLHDAIQGLPGSTPVRAKLMDRATEALDSLRSSAGNVPGIQRELATAYARLATVKGAPQGFNVGDLPAALRSYRNALALLEQVRKSAPGDLTVLRSMAEVEWPMSVILGRQGDRKGAEAFAQRALDLRETLARAEPEKLDARRELAEAYYLRGQAAVTAGDLDTARSVRRKALDLCESIAAEDPADANARYQIALAAKNLAAVEQRFRAFDDALKHLQRAREIDVQRCRNAPQNASAKLDLSFDWSELAELKIRTSDLPAAAGAYREARAIREELLARDPRNQRLRDRVAYIRSREGRVQLRLRHMQPALASFQRALELRRELAADPSNLAAQFAAAESRADLGAWHCAAGERPAGAAALEAALSRIQEIHRKSPLNLEDQESVAELRQHLQACQAAFQAPISPAAR